MWGTPEGGSRCTCGACRKEARGAQLARRSGNRQMNRGERTVTSNRGLGAHGECLFLVSPWPLPTVLLSCGIVLHFAHIMPVAGNRRNDTSKLRQCACVLAHAGPACPPLNYETSASSSHFKMQH